MSDFIKYPHLERLGHRAVQGITKGTVYVYPKLDGTNASLWYDDQNDELCFGSRNRKLSLDKDNAGFMAAMLNDPQFAPVLKMLKARPEWIFYGEWLVPHSIKHYEDDAWRKIYLFDVRDREAGSMIFSSDWVSEALYHGAQDFVIPQIAILENPTPQELDNIAKASNYLCKGQATGEGVVIKNYGWSSPMSPAGRSEHVWAKIVNPSFKNLAGQPGKAGVPGAKADTHEGDFIRDCLTTELVEKELAKLCNEIGTACNYGYDFLMEDLELKAVTLRSKGIIPRILNKMFEVLLEEEFPEWIRKKDNCNKTIDFQSLRKFCGLRVKDLIPYLF